MNNGCKNCIERTPCCHSNCLKYKEFKDEVARVNKIRHEYEITFHTLYSKKVYGWYK